MPAGAGDRVMAAILDLADNGCSSNARVSVSAETSGHAPTNAAASRERACSAICVRNGAYGK